MSWKAILGACLVILCSYQCSSAQVFTAVFEAEDSPGVSLNSAEVETNSDCQVCENETCQCPQTKAKVAVSCPTCAAVVSPYKDMAKAIPFVHWLYNHDHQPLPTSDEVDSRTAGKLVANTKRYVKLASYVQELDDTPVCPNSTKACSACTKCESTKCESTTCKSTSQSTNCQNAQHDQAHAKPVLKRVTRTPAPQAPTLETLPEYISQLIQSESGDTEKAAMIQTIVAMAIENGKLKMQLEMVQVRDEMTEQLIELQQQNAMLELQVEAQAEMHELVTEFYEELESRNTQPKTNSSQSVQSNCTDPNCHTCQTNPKTASYYQQSQVGANGFRRVPSLNSLANYQQSTDSPNSTNPNQPITRPVPQFQAYDQRPSSTRNQPQAWTQPNAPVPYRQSAVAPAPPSYRTPQPVKPANYPSWNGNDRKPQYQRTNQTSQSVRSPETTRSQVPANVAPNRSYQPK